MLAMTKWASLTKTSQSIFSTSLVWSSKEKLKDSEDLFLDPLKESHTCISKSMMIQLHSRRDLSTLLYSGMEIILGIEFRRSVTVSLVRGMSCLI